MEYRNGSASKGTELHQTTSSKSQKLDRYYTINVVTSKKSQAVFILSSILCGCHIFASILFFILLYYVIGSLTICIGLFFPLLIHIGAFKEKANNLQVSLGLSLIVSLVLIPLTAFGLVQISLLLFSDSPNGCWSGASININGVYKPCQHVVLIGSILAIILLCNLFLFSIVVVLQFLLLKVNDKNANANKIESKQDTIQGDLLSRIYEKHHTAKDEIKRARKDRHHQFNLHSVMEECPLDDNVDVPDCQNSGDDHPRFYVSRASPGARLPNSCIETKRREDSQSKTKKSASPILLSRPHDIELDSDHSKRTNAVGRHPHPSEKRITVEDFPLAFRDGLEKQSKIQDEFQQKRRARKQELSNMTALERVTYETYRSMAKNEGLEVSSSDSDHV